MAPPSEHLIIDEIVSRAESMAQQIGETLPGSPKLKITAEAIVQAATTARKKVQQWKGPLSLSRIRFYVLLAAVAWMAGWIYLNHFQSRSITVASPTPDSHLLRARARRSGSKHLRFVECKGSAEGLEQLRQGRADFTVVQGGVDVPTGHPVVGIVRREHVLWFPGPDFPPADGAPRVITLNAGQGSHVLGKIFFEQWGFAEVEWIHEWAEFSTRDDVKVPEADGVFVVVEPADPAVRRGIRKVVRAGFRLQDAVLGAYERHLPYLHRIPVETGYYHARDPIVPTGEVATYAVDNHLVAAPSTTDWQRSEAASIFQMEGEEVSVFHTPGTSIVSDLAALAEGTVNVVVILAALFGAEILLHRRSVQDLNNLTSRISLLQSDKDLAMLDDPVKAREHMRYLDFCCDLLGLLSTLAGYYAQENAALLFNGVTGTIHSRTNELKINIQLKLLQGDRFQRG